MYQGQYIRLYCQVGPSIPGTHFLSDWYYFFDYNSSFLATDIEWKFSGDLDAEMKNESSTMFLPRSDDFRSITKSSLKVKVLIERKHPSI